MKHKLNEGLLDWISNFLGSALNDVESITLKNQLRSNPKLKKADAALKDAQSAIHQELIKLYGSEEAIPQWARERYIGKK